MESRRSGARDLTRTAVLALLGRSGPLSRAEISRQLGLSPATVTQVSRHLLSSGMLVELENAPSSGGRPGQLLGLVGSAGRALGVKVTADHIVVVDVRLDGEVLTSRTLPFDALAAQPVRRLVALLRPLLAATSSDIPLLGIGVGVPGIVDDPDSGVVSADVLGWRDVPLGARLHKDLGVPVLVENDVNALAVAEQLYGHGREYRDFLVLTIGRGIGLGVVADGAVYRGSRGGAGEFGHFPVDVDGPQCDCGNRGCLEAVVGGEALVREARASGAIDDSGTFEDLFAAADSGDAAATRVFAEASAVLGRMTAGVVNVLDPQAVLMLGEGTVAWRHWDDAFCATLKSHVLPSLRDVNIVVEPWDDTNWALGAAALVLATPFEPATNTGRQSELVLARLHGKGVPS